MDSTVVGGISGRILQLSAGLAWVFVQTAVRSGNCVFLLCEGSVTGHVLWSESFCVNYLCWSFAVVPAELWPGRLFPSVGKNRHWLPNKSVNGLTYEHEFIGAEPIANSGSDGGENQPPPHGSMCADGRPVNLASGMVCGGVAEGCGWTIVAVELWLAGVAGVDGADCRLGVDGGGMTPGRFLGSTNIWPGPMPPVGFSRLMVGPFDRRVRSTLTWTDADFDAKAVSKVNLSAEFQICGARRASIFTSRSDGKEIV